MFWADEYKYEYLTKEELVRPLDTQLQFVLDSFLIPTELNNVAAYLITELHKKGRGYEYTSETVMSHGQIRRLVTRNIASQVM